MICVELVTMLAAWADDVSTGVNAQLPSVPRPAGEAAPPTVLVLTNYTDRQIAEGAIDDARIKLGPLLIFAPADDSVFSGLFGDDGDDTQDVVAMYVDGRSEDHIAARNAHRTMRALRRVLALRFAALNNAGLELSGCYIGNPGAIKVKLGASALGAAQVSAVAFIPFPVLDRWALGAPA